MSEPKPYWSSAEVAQIAAEMGLDSRDYTMSSFTTSLPGMTREQVEASLRMLEAIPPDDGRPLPKKRSRRTA